MRDAGEDAARPPWDNGGEGASAPRRDVRVRHRRVRSRRDGGNGNQGKDAGRTEKGSASASMGGGEARGEEKKGAKQKRGDGQRVAAASSRPYPRPHNQL